MKDNSIRSTHWHGTIRWTVKWWYWSKYTCTGMQLVHRNVVDWCRSIFNHVYRKMPSPDGVVDLTPRGRWDRKCAMPSVSHASTRTRFERKGRKNEKKKWKIARECYCVVGSLNDVDDQQRQFVNQTSVHNLMIYLPFTNGQPFFSRLPVWHSAIESQ